MGDAHLDSQLFPAASVHTTSKMTSFLLTMHFDKLLKIGGNALSIKDYSLIYDIGYW